MNSNLLRLQTKYEIYVYMVEKLYLDVRNGLIDVYHKISANPERSEDVRRVAFSVVEHIHANTKHDLCLIHPDVATQSLKATGSTICFRFAKSIGDFIAMAAENVTRSLYFLDGLNERFCKKIISDEMMLLEKQQRMQNKIYNMVEQINGYRGMVNDDLIDHVINGSFEVLDRLEQLNNSLPVSDSDDPSQLYTRWVDAGGKALFSITPANPMRYLNSLSCFIADKALEDDGGLTKSELTRLLANVSRRGFYGNSPEVCLDLSMFGDLVTNSVVTKILQRLQDRVKELNLAGTAVTNDVLIIIARYAPKLKKLILANNDQITFALPRFVTMASVEILDISNCRLKGFAVDMPRLRRITVGGGVDEYGNMIRVKRWFIDGLQHFLESRSRRNINSVIEMIGNCDSNIGYFLDIFEGLHGRMGDVPNVSWRVSTDQYNFRAFFTELSHPEYRGLNDINHDNLQDDIETWQHYMRFYLKLCKDYMFSYDSEKRQQLLEYTSKTSFIGSINKKLLPMSDRESLPWLVLIMKSVGGIDRSVSISLMLDAIREIMVSDVKLAVDMTMSMVDDVRFDYICRAILRLFIPTIDVRGYQNDCYIEGLLRVLIKSDSTRLQHLGRTSLHNAVRNVGLYPEFYNIVCHILIDWLEDGDKTIRDEAEVIIKVLGLTSLHGLSVRSVLAPVFVGILMQNKNNSSVIEYIDAMLEKMMSGGDDRQRLAMLIISNYYQSDNELIREKGKRLVEELKNSNSQNHKVDGGLGYRMNLILKELIATKSLPDYVKRPLLSLKDAFNDIDPPKQLHESKGIVPTKLQDNTRFFNETDHHLISATDSSDKSDVNGVNESKEVSEKEQFLPGEEQAQANTPGMGL